MSQDRRENKKKIGEKSEFFFFLFVFAFPLSCWWTGKHRKLWMERFHWKLRSTVSVFFLVVLDDVLQLLLNSSCCRNVLSSHSALKLFFLKSGNKIDFHFHFQCEFRLDSCGWRWRAAAAHKLQTETFFFLVVVVLIIFIFIIENYKSPCFCFWTIIIFIFFPIYSIQSTSLSIVFSMIVDNVFSSRWSRNLQRFLSNNRD